MLKGEVAHLAPDPSAVNRHRALRRAEDATTCAIVALSSAIPPTCARIGATDRTDRIPLEQPDRGRDRCWIDLDREWRFGEATEAQGRTACLVVVALELRRVAIGHALGEAQGVPLRRCRLGHELVPIMGIRRQDLPETQHHVGQTEFGLGLRAARSARPHPSCGEYPSVEGGLSGRLASVRRAVWILVCS